MQRKIAFMGTPNFAVPILKYIYQNGYEISAVYTQPPKKSNRGQKVNLSSVHKFAKEKKLNVFCPKKLSFSDVNKNMLFINPKYASEYVFFQDNDYHEFKIVISDLSILSFQLSNMNFFVKSKP